MGTWIAQLVRPPRQVIWRSEVRIPVQVQIFLLNSKQKRSSDLRKHFDIFITNDKLTQYKINWREHIQARMEEGSSAFKILASKPPGKRPLERPRRRWEDNIRMDLEETGINSVQDRNYLRALVNALNLRVP